jgi:glutathione S-transferase
MIKLIQFPSAFGVRNPSPFCLKLETWLRMTGIAHEVVWSGSTRGTPKGKLPCIEEDGQVLGDSELIIGHLIRRHGDLLDNALDTLQRARSVAWRTLFEEGLIFPLLYSRWIDPAGWAMMQRLFDPLPSPKRELVSEQQRESVRTRLLAQGLGAHAPDEIYGIGLRYLEAVEAQFGEQEFMLGENPTALDATAYGFLANLVDTHFDTPLNHRAQASAAFTAYCRRMRQRYFPELD